MKQICPGNGDGHGKDSRGAGVRKYTRLINNTIHLRSAASGFYRRLVEEEGFCRRWGNSTKE